MQFLPAIIRRRITPKMQRVLLIGSLSALLFTQKRSVKLTTVHKLNSVMELCNHEPALLMPMHLSKAIWRGDHGVELFDMSRLQAESEQHLNDFIQQIIVKIPAWLKYAGDEIIHGDLRRLIEHRDTILA